MAKNISLMGASYSDVPAVVLPQTGGGTARFDDASVTTAVAADVAQGKVFIAADGTITTGTASGGGSIVVVDTPDGHGGTIREITATNVTTLVEKTITQNGTYDPSNDNADGYSSVTVNVGGRTPVERSDVNFYDYDGTLLYSYTAAEAAELTEMPSNPSHTGLTAQGWNYTLAEMKTEVTAQGACDIGQMYVTDDGKSRLYCTFEEGRLSIYLGVIVNGTCVVDWGDGSATDTLTDTDEYHYNAVWANHTYASAGDYVITLTAVNGTYAFTHGCIHKTAVPNTSSEEKVYTATIKKVEVGINANVGYTAFETCASVETITIPNTVSTIGSGAFSECYRLRHLAFPSSVDEVLRSSKCYSLTSVSYPSTISTYYGLSDCPALERVVIPSTVTQIASSAFASNYALQSVYVPSGVSSMDSYAFQNCYGLKTVNVPDGVPNVRTYAFDACYILLSITLPSSVSSIQGYAFRNCYGLKEMHLQKTDTPVTLAASTSLSNVPSDCVFYVPQTEDHALLNAYKSATYWSSKASHIQEEP